MAKKRSQSRKQLDEIQQGRYPGGKNHAGTLMWILSKFPEHWAYAEPFLGSGALLRNKVPAYQSFGVDADARIVQHWHDLDLPGVSVTRGCGITWMSSVPNWSPWPASDWLWYIDAPYPDASCSHLRYQHSMSAEQHGRMLDICAESEVRIVVSCYDHPLYRRKLKDWHCDSRLCRTRGAAKRREFVWSNFDPDRQRGLTRSLAGGNPRTRQDCKRQCRRQAEIFSRLEPWRREAMLAELIRTESRLRRSELGF